jgi:hypothetical protein
MHGITIVKLKVKVLLAKVVFFDFCLLPPPNSDFHAVIMEFKILNGNETKEDAANLGLQQISTKNYRSGIPQYATKLLEIGIAFEGNSSKVVFKKYVKVAGNWHDE